MIPGTQKKKHKTILITKSLPAPAFKKTASGGSNSDAIIKRILLSIQTPSLLIY